MHLGRRFSLVCQENEYEEITNMRQKTRSKMLAAVIFLLCVPVLTSCVMFAESMITMQRQQGKDSFPVALTVLMLSLSCALSPRSLQANSG